MVRVIRCLKFHWETEDQSQIDSMVDLVLCCAAVFIESPWGVGGVYFLEVYGQMSLIVSSKKGKYWLIFRGLSG